MRILSVLAGTVIGCIIQPKVLVATATVQHHFIFMSFFKTPGHGSIIYYMVVHTPHPIAGIWKRGPESIAGAIPQLYRFYFGKRCIDIIEIKTYAHDPVRPAESRLAIYTNRVYTIVIEHIKLSRRAGIAIIKFISAGFHFGEN